MKAIIYTEYGAPDVLQLKEVDKPVPAEKEVRIRIFATAATSSDANARGFVFVPSGFKLLSRIAFGIRKPRKEIIGIDLAGEIESVGTEVSLFEKGDQVFGIDGNGLGAYAEYVCRPEESALAIMPANLTYEEAAAVPNGGLTALFFLRDKGKILSGQNVLINGASGMIGTYAVQLAKYYGTVVTGVCSTTNLELVKSLGADKVIDYTKEDFTKNGEAYDAILDTVGNLSFSQCKGSLEQNGIFLAGAGGVALIFQMLWSSIMGGKKVVTGPAPERKEDLVFLKELIEAGDIKPVIDRRYSLEQTAEAHRYVDGGHKKGNVVITVADGSKENDA